MIEELTPKSTAILSTPASSPSSTTWNPLPSQNGDTLLDFTHFMDFLSFQQGALTPKPPPASRWVWCYHFHLAIRSSVSGHDGVRNKGCCTHNDLRRRWKKTQKAERFLAKAPARISSTMRSHGDEESCLHLENIRLAFHHFSTCGTCGLCIASVNRSKRPLSWTARPARGVYIVGPYLHPDA